MTSVALRPLILLALMLAQLYVPAVGAQHASDLLGGAEDPVPVQDPNLVPGSSPVDAGVWPVDQLLDELARDANETEGRTFAQAVAAYNAARGEARNSTRQPMVYYIDGMGEGLAGTDGEAPPADPRDARRGGFGSWRVAARDGHEPAWNRAKAAARSGEVGFTNAGPDGSYPFYTNSILVSPELDLRNGFPMAQAEANETAFGAVWNLIFTTRPCPRGVQGFSPPCLSPQEDRPDPILDPPDAVYQFRFSARYNLATGNDPTQDGRDGVQVILWWGEAGRPPFTGYPDLSQCAAVNSTSGHEVGSGASRPFDRPPCTVLEPGSFRRTHVLAHSPPLEPAYPARRMANNAPAPAFTGASATASNPSGWDAYTIDVTPWAGHSVWIGFSFVSQGPVASPNFFHPEMGFRGFHLDNVQLTAPAPPVSLRVRPITEPDFRLPSAPGLPPVVGEGQAFNVSTEVVNMGGQPLRVALHMQVLYDSLELRNATLVRTLAPGEIFPFLETFAGLPGGNGYVARVTATNLDIDQDRLEANRGDHEASQSFTVSAQSTFVVHAIQRSQASVRVGEAVRFILPVENPGVNPVTVSASACLVDWKPYLDPTQPHDLDAKPPCSFGPLSNVVNGVQHFPHVKALVVPPLRTVTINWTVLAPPGQHKLFYEVEKGASIPDVLSTLTVERLLPPTQRPLQSTYRTFTALIGDNTAKDDVQNTAFWEDVPAWPVSLVRSRIHGFDSSNGFGPFTADAASIVDGATLQVANSATHLFVRLDGLSGTSHNHVQLLLDDKGDRRAGGASEDGALISSSNSTTNRNAFTDLHFSRDHLRWFRDVVRSGAAGHTSDKRTFEFIRPLGTGGQDLSAEAGKLVGLFLQVQNTAVPATFTFPGFAVSADGGGPAARNGNLSDEMRAWQLVRLATPADTSPQVGVSPGFGVEMEAPPVLVADTSDCSTWGSWTRTPVFSQSTVGVSRSETWVCAGYGGRNLTYEGTVPDSTCGGRACPPYSFASRLGTNSDRFHELFSPPLDVSGLEEPYLVLNHQYATQVWIVDEGGFTEVDGVPA
ncbi:MAG TPA: hypothetical protein VHI93_01115, partial [Candidatus Thermoplasmatota archaeon]|nr:hypothetical protein [Candidatus Thermoplasmatota archaeon]